MYRFKEIIIQRNTLLDKSNCKLLDEFKDVEEYKHYVLNHLNNPIVYEGILVSNPKLILNLKEYAVEDIEYTLIKYLNRMYYRSTPFGVFSEISVISQKGILNKYNRKKFIRPSGEWLSKLVKKIELNWDSIRISKYVWNNSLLELEKEFRFSIGSCLADRKKQTSKVIKKTKVLIYIQNIIGEKPMGFSEIVLKIKSKFNTDSTVVEHFLKQLIQEEIILSDCRELLKRNDLETINKRIANLPSLSSLYCRIRDILILFREYELTELGDGIRILKEILEAMSFIEVDNPIKVDLRGAYKDTKKLKINFLDFEEKLNYLFKIQVSSLSRYPHIDAYKTKFEETYGHFEYIPLLELLDENLGLGNPYSIHSTYQLNNIQTNKFTQYIKNEILTSINNQKDTVNLKRKDLEEFIVSDFKYPSSFELFVRVNNEKKIVVIPNSGSDRAGKSMGRFIHMFDEVSQEFFKDNFVNIIELPKFDHVLNLDNIAYNNKNTLKLMMSDETSEFRLKNILVKLEKSSEGSFFNFFDSVSKKSIEFSLTNSLNYSYHKNLSYISRFLLESTSEKYVTPLRIQHIIAEIAEYIGYCPRVEFEDVVLFPQAWIYEKNGVNEEECLLKFIQKWGIPNIVTYSNGDMYLCLNLSNKKHWKILLKEIKNMKGNYVNLFEGQILSDDPFSSEYVLSLYREDSIKVNENIEVNRIDEFMLGDEWVSIKYYGLGYRRKEFLLNYLKTFVEELVSKEYIDKFYFLNYSDPEPHIRVRFHLSDTKNFRRLFEKIVSFNKDMKIKHVINSVIFDTYRRETGRYGGEKLVSIVEEIFYKDSILCFEEIPKLDNCESEYRNYQIIRSTVSYLSELGLTTSEMMDLFEINRTSINANIIYREVKSKYPNIITELLNICHKQMTISNRGIEQFKILVSLLPLYRKRTIYFSLLHMHFNRISINNEDEKVFLEIIFKYLKHLVYLERRRDEN